MTTARRLLAVLPLAWASFALGASVRDAAPEPVGLGPVPLAAPATATGPSQAPALSLAPAAPSLPPQAAVSAPAAAAGASANAAPSTDRVDALGRLARALDKRGDGPAARLAEGLHYTDALTGLPNRAYLIERGASVLASAKEPAVALMDMDNFGAVNMGLADLLGVTGGRARADGVLAVAGAALGELAKARGVVVARLGGEEFAAMGERSAVLAFAADARRALPPGRVLSAAGMAEGGAERRAIAAAVERLGRVGQPVGSFTCGVAPAGELAPLAALKSADSALNEAKEQGRRATIRVVEGGAAREWTPPPAEAAPIVLAAPAPRDTASEVAALEARLDEHELRLFRETSFRDPLTTARNYEYLELKAADWDKEYSSVAALAVLASARNLKQINDLLGHDAGDAYLHRVGAILRRTVNQARRRKLDAHEPVRVASKEFLIVGRDAAVVVETARREVARQFSAGRILPAAEIARLRAESVRRGLVPARRADYIGTLRVVSEPLTGPDGRVDSRRALDRAFERLEAAKLSESSATKKP